MRFKRALVLFSTVVVTAFLLTGCGRLEISISDLPDHTGFLLNQKLTLADMTTHNLGLIEEYGDNDFWHRFEQVAKLNKWNFKEKSANRIAVSASFAYNQTASAAEMFSKELAWIADGYGAHVDKTDKELIPVSISVKQHSTALSTVYDVACDYDLRLDRLKERLKAPDDWANFIDLSSQAAIIVGAEIPGTVIKTNGAYDPATHKCIWNVPIGRKGQCYVSYKIEKSEAVWILGAIGILLAASIAAFVTIRVRAKKSANG